MPEVTIPSPNGWTSRAQPNTGLYGPGAVNFDTYKGFGESAQGFRRVRVISTAGATDAAASLTHLDASGNEYPLYYWLNDLYRETGSGVISIVGSLTEAYLPTFTRFAGVDTGVFLNGTNAEALSTRIVTNPVAVAFDLNKPGGSFTTSSTPSTGGSLSDGVYQIRVVAIDNVGAYSVISEPTAAVPITLSGGGSAQRIVLDLTSQTYDTRTVNWRVYMTAAGAGDTPTAFFQVGSDTAKATTTLNITATSTTGAIDNRNGFYRTAVMPLAGALMAVEYKDRLVIASLTSNLIAWSERDQPNHWFTTNSTSEIDGQWASTVTGLAATKDALYVFTKDAIFVVSGNFAFDDVTNTHNVRDPEPISTGLGCLAHGSVFVVDEGAVFFMSQRGPAIAAGGTVVPLSPGEIRNERLCWDYDNMDRCTGAYDLENGLACWAVPRKTNATRPQDGASVAGTPDRIYRYDVAQQNYSPPLEMEVVHLISRSQPGTVGQQSQEMKLFACGPHGTVNELNWSQAHGPGGDIITSADVSGTDFDGLQATAETSTSAAMVLSGVTDDALQGYGAVVRYHSGDTAYPGEEFYVTIVGNTTAAGTLTITWLGARTVSTGTKWTVRLAAMRQNPEVLLQFDADPTMRTQLQYVTALLPDSIGARAL